MHFRQIWFRCPCKLLIGLRNSGFRKTSIYIKGFFYLSALTEVKAQHFCFSDRPYLDSPDESKKGVFVRKMFISAAITGACLSAPADALEAPSVIGLHLATLHSQSGLCDINPGAYAVWRSGFTAGGYRNSECQKVSPYSGWTWQTTGPVRVGLTAGLITGYRQAPVLPLLVPSLTVDVSPTTVVRTTFVPKIEKRGTNALHFSIEFTL